MGRYLLVGIGVKQETHGEDDTDHGLRGGGLLHAFSPF